MENMTCRKEFNWVKMILFLFVTSFPLFANGKEEAPKVTTDLGIMNIVVGKGSYEIVLPYWKTGRF
ncbi:hypothetical protein FACS1894130_12160 [Spirochaetia bacterium]|nr:hypothetical protein FACS1894130_12160 [Spirochaetia bacterium]